MSWEGLNRRRFPRAHFPCLIKVQAQENAEEMLLTHTENISVGGVSVIIKKHVEQFSFLGLEIDLLDGTDPIVCQGKVMWTVRRKATDELKPSCYDLGIEFIDIAKEDHQRIKEIVDKIAKRYQKIKLD